MAHRILTLLLIGLVCGLVHPKFCLGQQITNYYPSEYSGGPDIYSITSDSLGFLYFANNKGVLVYDGTNWSSVDLSGYAEARTVKALSDGSVYVGGIGRIGQVFMDSSGNHQYDHFLDLRLYRGPVPEVWQILENQEKLYFQTYGMILVKDKLSDRLDTIAVTDSYIFSAFGEVFISQFGAGLSRHTEEGLEWIASIPNEDAAFQFFAVAHNQVLVLTSTSGLYSLNQTPNGSYNLQLIQTSVDTVLRNRGFYDGIRIRDNLFALGTWDGGVVLFDFDNGWFEVLDQSDGLISNRVNAIELGPFGDLWIGTDMGISVLEIDSLMVPQKPGQTLITELIINHDSTLFAGHSQNLLNASDEAIEIDGSDNSILLKFTTPGLNSKQNTYFKFLLQGHDKEWSEWTTRSEKEYTYLDAGTYTFMVKSLLPDGSESESAQVVLRVSLLWYQTSWVRAGLVFVVIIVIALLISVTKNLTRSKVQLEGLVQDRTLELQERQEELEKTNKELSRINHELDQFVYRSSHDLIAPVKSLKGLIQLAKMDKKEDQEQYLDMIRKQILRLEEFISYILDYSANTKKDLVLEKIDFNQIIQESLQKLSHYENAPNIEIVTNLPENGQFKSDKRRLAVVIDNLLSNAIKYHRLDQSNPKITISVDHVVTGVSLKVEDNGMGIDQVHLDRIFDMFYRAAEESEGSGLGLYIAKEAANRLGASISVQSQPGVGSQFIVNLPQQPKAANINSSADS